MIFLSEQRKLVFDNKDLVRFLQVKRGDELNFSIDISSDEENLSYQFTAKEMGQYSENPILLFSGVAVGKKAEFTLEVNTIQLDDLFAKDEKQIELMCEFAVWRGENVLKSLNEITLTVFNKITGPGEVDENGGEYPPASELVTFSEMSDEVSRQIEELGAHTSIENVAGDLKLSPELKIDPETKIISFAEEITTKSLWDFSGETKRVTKGNPESLDLMNLEMTQKALEDAGSHTSIGGVSGAISLSDGLEIDSETKTLGIGNAAVESLTIADGGITQNTDISLEGKFFFIGQNSVPTTGNNYFWQFNFAHGSAYIQARRISYDGKKHPTNMGFMGSVDFHDGSFNISNRVTSFTCGAPLTQNGSSIFNGATIFNSDVTASVFHSHDNILHIGNYANSYDQQYKNKSYLSINTSGTGVDLSSAYWDADGNLRVAQISFNSTVWVHKTLASDGIVWCMNEFWSGKKAKFKGRIESYEEGLSNIDLVDSNGRQILFLDNSEATPTLRIGSRSGALDADKNAREISIFSVDCGIIGSGGSWTVLGSIYNSSASGGGQYIHTNSNAAINGSFTFNALTTFNADIVNTTGVFRTPEGVTAKFGDYVESPTAADANKVWFELGSYPNSHATLTAYTVTSAGIKQPTGIRLGSAGGSSIVVVGNIITYGGSSFTGGVTRTTKVNPQPEDVMNKEMVDTAIANVGSHTTIDGVAGDILLSDGLTINTDTKTLGLGDIKSESVQSSSGEFLAPLKSEESSIFVGDYIKNIDPQNYKKGYFELSNRTNGVDGVIKYHYYNRDGGHVLGSNIIFETPLLKGNALQCNQFSQLHGNVTNILNGSSIFGNTCTFNSAAFLNAGLTNSTGNYLSPGRTTIAMGDVVTVPTVADAGKSWFVVSPFGERSKLLTVKSVNSDGLIITEPLYTETLTGVNQLASESDFLLKGKISTYSTGLSNIDLVDSNGRQIIFLDNNESEPILRIGSKTSSGDNDKNAREVSIFSRSAGIWSSGESWFVRGNLHNSVSGGKYIDTVSNADLQGITSFNALTTFNAEAVFNNTATYNGLGIFNAGLTNTNGVISSQNKVQIFGDYTPTPTTADAGKNWLEIKNTAPSGVDVAFSAKYISSTGSIAHGQLRFENILVCNSSLLCFGTGDFRSKVKVDGDLTVSNGNMITPIVATPTRIGEYVENPTIDDVGKLWIEIQKRDGYIKILGKEVVNNVGEIEVQNYPVQI